MPAHSIPELECALEIEKSTNRRQQLLKQIWELQSSLKQESASSNGPDEQPTRSLRPLSIPKREDSRVTKELSTASTAV